MTSHSLTISNKPGELIGMFYSPYTERARWALSHHAVPYRYHEHLTLIGEPLLHWRARSLKHDLTVPVFIHQGRRLTDSYDIARYVDQIGSGKKLFPANRLAEIEQWNRHSEAAMQASRSIVVTRLKTNPEAQIDHLPKLLPEPLDGVLRSVAGPVAKMAIRYLEKTFHIEPKIAEHTEKLRAEFLNLRQALQGKKYILGDFSYADITMAVCIQSLEPLREPYLRLGHAAREVWRVETLAREFSDLIDWRDEVYCLHRRRDVQ